MKSNHLAILQLIEKCKIRFVEKQQNEVISNFLKYLEDASTDNIKMAIDRISMKIDLLSSNEERLEKHYKSILGTIMDYVIKVHQELLKVDKNSKIDTNGRKLFELAGIAKEGLKENLESFVSSVVDSIVGGIKTDTYIEKTITTFNLMDSFIDLSTIQAYAIKFNAFN